MTGGISKFNYPLTYKGLEYPTGSSVLSLGLKSKLVFVDPFLV